MITVHEVRASSTHDLRRRVLRGGDPEADVDFPDDAAPGTVHLGALDGDGHLVGVLTLLPCPTERRPGARAWRVRGMAVAPELQGCGVGRALLAAATDHVLTADGDVIWADGRDTALGFYERLGWVVEGDGYLTSIGIPHHFVVLDLRPRPSG